MTDLKIPGWELASACNREEDTKRKLTHRKRFLKFHKRKEAWETKTTQLFSRRISSAFPRLRGLLVSLPCIVSHYDLCSEKIQPLDGKVGLTGFQSLLYQKQERLQLKSGLPRCCLNVSAADKRPQLRSDYGGEIAR